MIVPMKKVSLIIMGDKKDEALKKLRKLGIVHVEISEGSGERLLELNERIALLQSAVFGLSKPKKSEPKELDFDQALSVAKEITALREQKKDLEGRLISLNTEIERLKNWGNIRPSEISALAEKGVEISLYEMPTVEYKSLSENVKTLCLEKTKTSVKLLLIKSGADDEEEVEKSLASYQFKLPQKSTEELRQEIAELNNRINSIEEKMVSFADCIKSMENAVEVCQREIEFEVYSTGMAKENLSSNPNGNLSIAYFKGYIEAENLEKLKETAADNSWGLLVEEPSADDNVPTKLKNNKLVSFFEDYCQDIQKLDLLQKLLF